MYTLLNILQVVLHCDLCDVKLNSLKHRADHNLSEEHQENKKQLIEENARCRASLAFNKPIFTEEFLVYNKGNCAVFYRYTRLHFLEKCLHCPPADYAARLFVKPQFEGLCAAF